MEDRAMKKNIFKFITYSSIVAVVVFLGLPSVQALEVKLSGQVNRAVMWADNGKDTSVLNVDNDNSSTRFSLTGSEQVNDSVTVGVVWENEFQSNASNNVDVGQDDDGTSAFNDRKLKAFLWCLSASFLSARGMVRPMGPRGGSVRHRRDHVLGSQ